MNATVKEYINSVYSLLQNRKYGICNKEIPVYPDLCNLEAQTFSSCTFTIGSQGCIIIIEEL